MENILWVAFTADARKRQLAAHPEAITTFRKGAKWLRSDLVGQRVQLVNCGEFHQPPCGPDCEVFATGTVLSVEFCRFKDIPQVSHDRQSPDMTPEARLGIMQRVYGEYDENTFTTVVTIGNLSVAPLAAGA